jgi:hypothetical protein
LEGLKALFAHCCNSGKGSGDDDALHGASVERVET